MKFSEKIIFMRKKRQISQEKLAKKMGVSRQTIYKWEADLNTPEFNKIQKLAEIFDISYDLLLDEKIDLNEYFKKEDISKNMTNKSEILKDEEVGCDSEASMVKNKELNIKSVLLLVLVFLAIAAVVVGAILISNFLKDKNTDLSTNESSIVDTNSDVIVDIDTDIDEDTDTDTDVLDNSKDENVVYVYFDAKEGELIEKQRKINLGEKLGKLPTPSSTKEDLVFVHWETISGIKVSENTIVDSDVILYAVYENVSNTMHITLDANGGAVSKNELYLEKLSILSDYLPIPIHSEGLKFLGWFDENGIKIFDNYKYNTDKALIAYWGKLDICPYTKGAHSWNGWNYSNSNPTCEKDGIATKDCINCYYEEEMVMADALGHKYEIWNYVAMGQWSKCSRCNNVKTIEYKSLSDTIEKTEITGEIYGKENYTVLHDGFFDNVVGPLCGNNQEMIIDVFLKEATFVDCIFTHGDGDVSFKILALYPTEDDYVELCDGYFVKEEPQGYDVNSYIKAIRIICTVNSYGYWQEIAFAQIPKEEK